VEAVIEDDGLSVVEVKSEIEEMINEDGLYTLKNIINDEWIVLQGSRIDAFGIADLGENYLNGGFDIK
jgi:hypothetical protein